MFFPMFSLKTLNNHGENMAHVFDKKVIIMYILTLMRYNIVFKFGLKALSGDLSGR